MTVRANGVETVGKEGTEEREIGVPVRCRAVSVIYGGARERNSAQVSSGDGEGKWGGNSMGRRLRRSARSEFRSVSSGDGEGKWGGNSMGRRERRSARPEFRSGVERCR